MKTICEFVLLGLLLGAVTLPACAKTQEQEGESSKEQGATTLALTLAQQETIGLTTVQVEVQEVQPFLASFGRVIPRLQGRVQVTSPVVGRVTMQSAELILTPGTAVRKGQLLATVEQTYTASEQVQLDVGKQGATGAVQEAKATLAAAEAEYRRSQNLLQAKIVSRKRLEEAEAAWLQAKSRYDSARRQEASYQAATTTGRNSLRQYALTAPIAGVVIQAEITAGQQVDTTTPLFTIADLSTVWVEAPIFEGDLDTIERESSATIRGVGEAGSSWTGRPLHAGDVIDAVKRTANLLYEVANSDDRLKLGMSVTVEVPTGRKAQAVMVPETALIETGGGKGLVYVRRNPTLFAEEEVAIGVRQHDLVAVAGGVKEGEEVVVIGAPELFGQASGHSPVPS